MVGNCYIVPKEIRERVAQRKTNRVVILPLFFLYYTQNSCWRMCCLPSLFISVLRTIHLGENEDILELINDP
jgi:hypothetical protein